MDSEQRYFTTHQVSLLLGVSLPTIINWINSGRLEAHRTPGGHRRIEKKDLLALIRRHGLPMPEEFSEESAAARVLILASSGTDVSGLSDLILRAGYDPGTALGELEIGYALAAHRAPDALIFDLHSLGKRAFSIMDELTRFDADFRPPPAFGFTGDTMSEKDLRRAGSAGFLAIFHPEVTPVEFRGRLERAFRTWPGGER